MIQGITALEYLVGSKVAPQKLFHSVSSNRHPYPDEVSGLVFCVVSLKIVVTAVDPLLVLVTQPGELSSFFGALQVASYVEVVFIGDDQ